MEYTQILYSVDDHVATLTLNRPAHLNAFTVTMMREMIDAFGQVDADDDVRAVIVTGAGRAFCAGADLAGGGGNLSLREPTGPGRGPPGAGGRGLGAPGRRWPGRPADLRVHEARDRRRERRRRGRRDHDDAADGHPGD